MMSNKNEQWKLQPSYTVGCTHCFMPEDTCHPTQEAAIAALTSIGWTANEAGAWCPDCTQMLYARSGHNHTFAVGDVVVDAVRRLSLGEILRIGEGYMEVKMPDGYPTVYCMCEVAKK